VSCRTLHQYSSPFTASMLNTSCFSSACSNRRSH
jgi:hypothetical protein